MIVKRTSVAYAALGIALVCGCKSEHHDAKPTPEPAETSKPRAEQDDPSTPAAVQALPPEQAFARDPKAAAQPMGPVPVGTGVCAFIDKSYDGQDTPSTEKMVVKIKDGKIVRAQYTYRGSYAVDGLAENLTIPIGEGAWVPLSFTVGGSTKEFKVKLKAKTMTFKGTAADMPEGDCVWNASSDE
jgi:hypothetical protein